MLVRIHTAFCLLIITVSPWQVVQGDSAVGAAGSSCLQCHSPKREGFSAAHSFAAGNCVICHAGDAADMTEGGAHVGLIAFPGELANAMRTCGSCHGDKVASVTNNLMHTGRGIVDVTRRLIDGSSGPRDSVNFQSLGHGIADSLLRKQCASCHLGQPKTKHEHDVMRDRGGGCLACHINHYPDEAHPALTVKVSDARCFGCHSRSGRISMSYTGLAEVDAASQQQTAGGLRLPDGRRVERKPADVHYLAGMSCIDCHTRVGLMGDAGDADHQRQAVDISCTDCHDDDAKPTGSNGILKTAKNDTPLTHIELRADGAWLHTKITDRVLKIPALDRKYHAEDSDHQRLECAACHSQWAPQCFGCHIEYDAEGKQWDHVERADTAGHWSEQRSDFRNGLATLGVNENNRIELFVPGMIMTVAHPDWQENRFVRVFAPLSPHTSGASRSCDSCHRAGEALGLGQGEFLNKNGQRHFVPANGLREDGLPNDAWSNLDRSLGGGTPVDGQRPLTTDEMNIVLDAPLP